MKRRAVGRGAPAGDPIRARPWQPHDAPARVLAIRLHALGDTILTLPPLAALRRALPSAAIDFLTREEVADVPKGVVLFDHVFEIGGGRDPRRMLLSALRLVPRLRARRYDVVLDLQRSRISRTVRVLLRPTAWSEFDRSSPRSAAERTRATIQAAGLRPLDVPAGLELRRPAAGLDALRRAGWDGASPLVVLNPAGGFPGRAWPIEAWDRFAALWLERVPEARFVVLGLDALAPKAEALRRRVDTGTAGLPGDVPAGVPGAEGGSDGERVLDLTGRTDAAEAFGVLQRASLVVSEDSGLMHMAWVAGAPTLALFGATRSDWAWPQGPHADGIRACVRAEGACADGQCRAGPPTCLERLAPEAVVARAAALAGG